MICKHILSITFLNEPELIFLYIVKWFQVVIYNNDNLASVFVANFICKRVKNNLFAH